MVHASSVHGADTGMHADGDLLIVRELRKMSTLSKQGAKIAAPVSDEQLKWLNWPDFVQVCHPSERHKFTAHRGHLLGIYTPWWPQL